MNVLITGGNGSIGSHLAEALSGERYNVSILDKIFTKNTAELICKKTIADICDYTSVSAAVRGNDIIVHLAAVSRVEWGQQNPHECLRVNILGTLNLIKAVRENCQNGIIIFGSSREVYGEPVSLPVKEEHPKVPTSVYGVSKLASESLLRTYHSTDGLRYVILRFSNVYGSTRDLPERVIPKFSKLALEGRPLIVYGGQQVLDFTFIDDVVAGIVSAIDKVANNDDDVLNNDFNLVSGVGTPILKLAELIRRMTNSQSEIVVRERRSFDVSNFVGTYKKANRLLGYTPKYSLRRGLRVYLRRMNSLPDQ